MPGYRRAQPSPLIKEGTTDSVELIKTQLLLIKEIMNVSCLQNTTLPRRQKQLVAYINDVQKGPSSCPS
jgi:hypothetical protein